MKHRIVTAAQMKEIERAGDAHGLSYLQMMENAGLAAYAELQKQFPHPGRLLVVCGKGNNGGFISESIRTCGAEQPILASSIRQCPMTALNKISRIRVNGFIKISAFTSNRYHSHSYAR